MLYLLIYKWFYQCIYTILKRMYIYECASMDLRMRIYGSTNTQLLMNKHYTIEVTEQHHW